MSRHNLTPNTGGGTFDSLLLLKPMFIIGEVPVSDLSNYHLADQTLYYHYFYTLRINITLTRSTLLPPHFFPISPPPVAIRLLSLR